MLTITSILAMFSLLVICAFVLFWTKKVNFPYTVALVIVGLCLATLSNFSALKPIFGFLTEFQLTPELLFYIFLPTLIFESAYNMNVRQIVDNFWSITILSVIGLLISALLIAFLLHLLLPLVGLNINFIILLLFASIISATDPVAVLALFKEYGAPKRLTLIFEGESLFNDGTAVALFLVVLAIAQEGFHGTETVVNGIETFLMMIILGVICGLAIAMLFTKFIKYFRANEFVSITLLIISAHMIFIISELINRNEIFGLHVHVSPIIATTIGALFLGNYARHILSPHSEEYIEKSVAHLAFIVNSLVFILIGILFATTKINFGDLILPILLTIVVVAFARAASIYLSIIPLNKLKLEEKIPTNWQHLLSWGSLRGALAIIIVLLIPNEFTINNWNYAFSPKEFLIALTTGCILATLLVKATTIKYFMDKFQVYDFDILKEIGKINFGLFALLNQQKKYNSFVEKGYVLFDNQESADKQKEIIDTEIKACREKQQKLLEQYGEKVFIHELHLRAIHIEQAYLKELYVNDEISEKVYRRILKKLNIQREKIENLELENFNPSVYTDKKDIFDRFINFISSPLTKDRNILSEHDKLEYYRAQTIISRKVVKNLSEINDFFQIKLYPETVFSSVISLYENYRKQSNAKFEKILETHKGKMEREINLLNHHSIQHASDKSFRYLKEMSLINEGDIANFKIYAKM